MLVEISSDLYPQKYNSICLVMALGIQSCFIFLLFVRKMLLSDVIERVEWNLNVATIKDYSAELNIDEKGYLDWYENVFHGPGGDYERNISPGLSLKNHIIDKVERQLTNELMDYKADRRRRKTFWDTPCGLTRSEKVQIDIDEIYIADLAFGNKNDELIKLLQRRGQAIEAQNFEQKHDVENAVNKEISENYDQIITPTIAYITFEEEVGTAIAFEFNQNRQTRLLGK